MSVQSHRLRPICRPVHIGLFQAPEFRCLPEDGHARLLLVCLLVHPHGGTFHLPGLYNVGPDGLREAALMPRKSFAKGLRDLYACNVASHDDEARLIWVPSALRLIGPPANPNVAKGYARSLAQLTMSPLVAEAMQVYRAFLKPFGDAFSCHFEDRETLPKGFTQAAANSSPSLASHSPNRNSNKNLNFNSDTEALTCVQAVVQFVAQAGWASVDAGTVERLMQGISSGFSWADFARKAESVADRQDIRDPLAYVFACMGASNSGQQDDPCLAESPSRTRAAAAARAIALNLHG